MSGVVVAIVGAESTGKTTLAARLAAAVVGNGRLRVAVVGEHLRDWCNAAGRTPRVDEQRAIAIEQHARIDAAAAGHDVVVADTTALLTAVYSRHVFGDRSLEARAIALHARAALTLLTAIDLPWVADGLQRTGEHVREPVDTMLRELLGTARVPWAVIGGTGPARLRQAIAAISPLLRGPSAEATRPQARAGAFTRWLDAEPAGHPAAAVPSWSCACCSVPEFERALMRRTGTGTPGGP